MTSIVTRSMQLILGCLLLMNSTGLNAAVTPSKPLDMLEQQREYDRLDKQAAIRERIHPVGQVHVITLADATSATTNTASASATQAAAASTTPSGEETYHKFCVVCHQAGVAGAPKLGDKAAWDARIAAAKDQPGGLLAIVKAGKNAMPPKGTCMDCSDEMLQAAIDYMLEKSK